MPTARLAIPSPRPSPDRKPAKADESTPKRVLVIDDAQASTRLTCLTLEKISTFSTLEVNQSNRALQAAQQFRPDLILLDVEMPGMDGATVWRQLRADPELQQVPIVFLTGLLTEAEASVRRFEGNTRVLAKPLTLTKLASAIAGHLDGLCSPATLPEGHAP